MLPLPSINSNLRIQRPLHIPHPGLESMPPMTRVDLSSNVKLLSNDGQNRDSLGLLTARVIPVYKKGEHCLTQNYHHISLLSLFHKILEKLIVNRLSDFLTINFILYSHQFGFRKNIQQH